MLNNFIIPFIVLFIIGYGFFKKCDIYDQFIAGSFDGLKIVLDIIPAILAMILAVNIFVDSGLLLDLFKGSKYAEIFPMIFLRPISGNASLAYLSQIYALHGPDSFLGYLGSVIQGATDTTIYVLALYFSSIKIKNSRYALWVGLAADFFGILAAFIVVRFFF